MRTDLFAEAGDACDSCLWWLELVGWFGTLVRLLEVSFRTLPGVFPLKCGGFGFTRDDALLLNQVRKSSLQTVGLIGCAPAPVFDLLGWLVLAFLLA